MQKVKVVQTCDIAVAKMCTMDKVGDKLVMR